MGHHSVANKDDCTSLATASDTATASDKLSSNVIETHKVVYAFRKCRPELLLGIRHNLPSIANTLYADWLIPPDIVEDCINTHINQSIRTLRLLNALEDRMKVEPRTFVKFVEVLEKETSLRMLAEKMTTTYCNTTPEEPQEYHCTSSARYADHLKDVYRKSPVAMDNNSTPSRTYIDLAIIPHDPHDVYTLKQHTTQGNVDEVLVGREAMRTQSVLSQEDSTLVVVQGAPGIGKSTLVWELCRRWADAATAQHLRLMVLVRLGEAGICELKDLFPHPDRELQQAVTDEVVYTNGEKVLFILDGFEDLPPDARSRGPVCQLIKGRLLPKCSVLVTSRPSATAHLLAICRPQIRRHLEILGFTEQCITKYAKSVFHSEPELLQDFLTYTSPAHNPALHGLMYVPLNAAIITDVYRTCTQTGRPTPRTLTQLYSCLCLTLLQRHYTNKQPSISINKLSDLHAEDKRQFWKLAEKAFEGFRRNEMIYNARSIPSDFVHFGFLDTVTTTYGGGESLYNFLHLTVQEFLAAFYISHHPFGNTIFDQYQGDQRWNLVWRFTAGLTGYRYFKDKSQNHIFVTVTKEKVWVSQLLVHCLFEAQTDFDYCGAKTVVASSSANPENMFALGYCIAKSAPQTQWDVELHEGSMDSFVWGLKSTPTCGGIVKALTLNDIGWSLDLLTQHILQHISYLSLIGCRLESCAVALPEVLKWMTNLNKLKLCHNELDLELLTAILEQLCNSRVTSLHMNRNYCSGTTLNSKMLAALARLVDHTHGTLQTLTIGQNKHSRNFDPHLVFRPSSLKKLNISLEKYNSSLLELLQHNKCLTSVTMRWGERPLADSLVHILSQNTTLQILCVGPFTQPEDVHTLQALVEALDTNTALKTLKLIVKEEILQMVKTHDLESHSASRVSWQLC